MMTGAKITAFQVSPDEKKQNQNNPFGSIKPRQLFASTRGFKEEDYDGEMLLIENAAKTNFKNDFNPLKKNDKGSLLIRQRTTEKIKTEEESMILVSDKRDSQHLYESKIGQSQRNLKE